MNFKTSKGIFCKPTIGPIPPGPKMQYILCSTGGRSWNLGRGLQLDRKPFFEGKGFACDPSKSEGGGGGTQFYQMQLRWQFKDLIKCFKNEKNGFNRQFAFILNRFGQKMNKWLESSHNTKILTNLGGNILSPALYWKRGQNMSAKICQKFLYCYLTLTD